MHSDKDNIWEFQCKHTSAECGTGKIIQIRQYFMETSIKKNYAIRKFLVTLGLFLEWIWCYKFWTNRITELLICRFICMKIYSTNVSFSYDRDHNKGHTVSVFLKCRLWTKLSLVSSWLGHKKLVFIFSTLSYVGAIVSTFCRTSIFIYELKYKLIKIYIQVPEIEMNKQIGVNQC